MGSARKAWSTLALDPPVPAHLAEEFRRRVYFISEGIEDFTCEGEGGRVERVKVLVDRETEDPEALLEKIRRVVAREVLPLRLPEETVAWHRAADPVRPPSDIYPALREQGLVVELGEGQVGLAEPLLSLMDRLDRRLRAIGLSLPASREYRYPTLIPSHVLQRSGYVRSFPHFLMFVTRLHNDADGYDDFLAACEDCGGLPPNLFEFCGNDDYCLPPTMCYHTFQQMAGRRLISAEAVTARGKSFRYESRYHRGLARLWDFTIREIVFFGDRPFVLDARQRVMNDAFTLMEELRLSGYCSVANDPFFGGGDAATRIAAQQMMALKYELRLDIGPQETIAVGSFNLHERHFTDAFDIASTADEATFSGCVGFGLERLTYAFVCQHGSDPQGWPPISGVTAEVSDAH